MRLGRRARLWELPPPGCRIWAGRIKRFRQLGHCSIRAVQTDAISDDADWFGADWSAPPQGDGLKAKLLYKEVDYESGICGTAG
ncbi:hypothetical protein Defa_13070 [Desulfovibrio sp. TH_2024_36128]|uniref:Uncharacterized protein n=1 Tax=Desulfovibrio falkowii TaxID=3136602 RepID=A0ABQ0E7Q6_9BACT